MTLAEQYALFVSQLEWTRLPTEVKQIALELFSDWFANAVAGFDSPLAQALQSLSPVHHGPGRAIRVGDLVPAEPLWAALVNASAAHAQEFDDSSRAGLYHPGAPILSAAFSAACKAETSGPALLAGMVAGYEVSLRLASAVNPSHYKLWHTTGTVGSFGAAAAAGFALGLGRRRIAAAFGIAGTQAAGLWEVLPDAPQVKNLHPAKAAFAGLLAALLAQKGIAGPLTILEGSRGFFAATVPEPVSAKKCTEGLDKEWLILDTTFKAYPVCGHAMTPIEASLKLHGQFDIEMVEEVEVRAHPVSLQIASQFHPADEHQAKFSIPYCVAVALFKGRVGPDEFSSQLRQSAKLQGLLKKIRLIPDDELAKTPSLRPARICVRLAGGKTLVAVAEVRKGDPEHPMTANEKYEKFLKLTGNTWGVRGAENVFESIAMLPRAESVLKWAEGLRSLVKQQPTT
ncbi:MAG: MmgE/PrpD family protein [Deltaproteobacteria bacterium]|nr:MmgE/PrpD family protein [Deltaproteobacteria bacterium]